MKRLTTESNNEEVPNKKLKLVVKQKHNHKKYAAKQLPKKDVNNVKQKKKSTNNKNKLKNIVDLKTSKSADKLSKNKNLNKKPTILPGAVEKETRSKSVSGKQLGKKITTVNQKTKSKFPIGKGIVKLKVSKKKEKCEKPADWNEYKKMKKELYIKRKQNSLYEISVKAKKLGENLRRKTLKGGEQERTKLTVELHDLLGKQGNYVKFVLQHDMARIVQYLLKFGSETIRKEIAEELIPGTVTMLQSKYGKFCVKRMLKYGNAETRSRVIRACYGNVVKLASHVVSAAVLDYGFATWATALERQHFVQEFYGDMYKQNKDDRIKHVRDAYRLSSDMKEAILGATKTNLGRILNKELLDSHLVQTALLQFLEECSPTDQSEIVSQLASHVVVLSNSKEGANVAMLCFWHGTNKDKKNCMKALKEHVVELAKHPHGHKTIIAILDSIDDTVLLNKMLLTEIISHGTELALDDFGRRILLWLTGPANPAYFHPTYINELMENRKKSGSKKDQEIRRSEILSYVIVPLLDTIIKDANIWLSNCKSAVVLYAVLIAGDGLKLIETFEKVAEIITSPNWKIKEIKADHEVEESGVEHSGLHMVLKKLIVNDKLSEKLNKPLFTTTLMTYMDTDVVKRWIPCNRTCFLMVNIFENASVDIQKKLKALLQPHIHTIEKYTKRAGAEVLLKKITK